MSLSHEDVLEILALLDASDFDELRLETSGYKLHLRRSGARPPDVAHAPEAARPPAEAAAVEAVANERAAGETVANETVAAGPDPNLVDVTAPLLGTFYAAPQPGAPPFVAVGSAVDDGTVIGIVEVMKLMNSVCAGVTGVVAAIVARDGALVEYGEVLMRVARGGGGSSHASS